MPSSPRPGAHSLTFASWYASPVKSFILPEYVETVAQAYAAGATRYIHRSTRPYNPRVLRFVDVEAEVGEESEVIGSPSSQDSSDGAY